jgi:hypothetical protein
LRHPERFADVGSGATAVSTLPPTQKHHGCELDVF